MHRLLSLWFVFILAACATPAQPPAVGTAGFMVTTNGMSLYTYDRDEVGSGRSACLGQCAVTFPPYLAPAGATAEGDFTLIPRDGGGLQWAYRGKPLYRFIGDGQPGDINGRGLNGVWQLARQ